MATFDLTQEPVELGVDQTHILVDVHLDVIDVGALELDATCEVIAEISPVESSASEVTIDIISYDTSLSGIIETAYLTANETTLEIIESCMQGPAGPAGPPGSGGLSLTEQALMGETKLIYTLPLSLYNTANFQLSIMDLVNDFQVFRDIQYTFGTPRVKCRSSGINNKDPINYKLSYVKTATDFEVYLKNLMPNTLLIKGLVFPI